MTSCETLEAHVRPKQILTNITYGSSKRADKDIHIKTDVIQRGMYHVRPERIRGCRILPTFISVGSDTSHSDTNRYHLPVLVWTVTRPTQTQTDLSLTH